MFYTNHWTRLYIPLHHCLQNALPSTHMLLSISTSKISLYGNSKKDWTAITWAKRTAKQVATARSYILTGFRKSAVPSRILVRYQIHQSLLAFLPSTTTLQEDPSDHVRNYPQLWHRAPPWQVWQTAYQKASKGIQAYPRPTPNNENPSSASLPFQFPSLIHSSSRPGWFPSSFIFDDPSSPLQHPRKSQTHEHLHSSLKDLRQCWSASSSNSSNHSPRKATLSWSPIGKLWCYTGLKNHSTAAPLARVFGRLAAGHDCRRWDFQKGRKGRKKGRSRYMENLLVWIVMMRLLELKHLGMWDEIVMFGRYSYDMRLR